MLTTAEEKIDCRCNLAFVHGVVHLALNWMFGLELIWNVRVASQSYISLQDKQSYPNCRICMTNGMSLVLLARRDIESTSWI